jgi:hypothetical protein
MATFYLYNTTGGNIQLADVGLYIAAADNFQVLQNDIDDGIFYAGGDLDTQLNSGNLVLTEDPTIPPATQYTYAEAVELLSLEEFAREINYDDTVTGLGVDNVQDAIEAITVAQFPDFVITLEVGLIFTNDGDFVFKSP